MLNEGARKTLKAIAEAVILKGKFFPQGGEADATKIANFIGRNRFLSLILNFVLFLFEHSTIFRFKRFSKLTLEERAAVIERWQRGNLFKSQFIEVILGMVKFAHFNDEKIYIAINSAWNKAPAFVEEPSYFRQVKDAKEFSDGESIECDACVVGTGAGGGAVANELAERGVATVILEEGKYWDRRSFNGRPLEAVEKFYRNKGLTLAFGNTILAVPMGRMVGGSTAINTATCWRTPEWILNRWVQEFGLKEFTPEKLERYFKKVEAIIQVEQAKDKVIGGIKDVIARGCDALGFRHYPLRRNAPDCDAQGVCDFGCPTDARLSTNISYIPRALRSGALLITSAKVQRGLVENGRAVGVEAVSVEDGRRIIIRSKVVILACGSIMTPALLLNQGICNSSGMVGRNLTIHPAVELGAFFENDDISSHKSVPQAYCIDALHREGILFLHAGLQIEIGAVALPMIGESYSYIMSNYEHLAWFGVMIEDSPSGRVTLFKGKPVILYWLKRREMELLKKGIATMARIFFAGKASMVFLPVRGWEVLKSDNEIDGFLSAKITPRDVRGIIGFHPLGTCRIGLNPATSVVTQDHETHDIKNLYICDGSVVPTSIGVNPQETIMALATRAGERIAGLLL